MSPKCVSSAKWQCMTECLPVRRRLIVAVVSQLAKLCPTPTWTTIFLNVSTAVNLTSLDFNGNIAKNAKTNGEIRL